MSDHLSSLMFDELSAGLAAPEVKSHAEGCDSCREQHARLKSEEDRIRVSAHYLRIRERMRAESRPPRLRFAPPFLGAALAACLVAAFGVVLSPRDGTRLKGAAHLRLLDPAGTPVEGTVAPGSRVSLSVGAMGHPYALLMSVDETGAVERLWPVQSAKSGRIPSGADVRLDPPFEVTPGSSALWAFFSDRPIREEDARRALEQAADEARQRGTALGEVAPSSVTGEAARAYTRLVVQ